MRPITSIASPTGVAFDRASRPEPVPAARGEPVSEARALVPMAPPRRRDDGSRGRSSASFVAHLIATHHQLPQTRERRRATPGEAILAYTRRDAGPSCGRVLAEVA